MKKLCKNQTLCLCCKAKDLIYKVIKIPLATNFPRDILKKQRAIFQKDRQRLSA